MKFRIWYSRKVKAGRAYEMLEIGASQEADYAYEDIESVFEDLRKFVNERIKEEQDRLLEQCVKRPEVNKK